MPTFSGRPVTPDNDDCPSLSDIAIQTGRTPRFAGATDGFWSVLNHLLVCGAIASQWYPDNQRMVLLALLHDAHEAVTGDISTLWKTRSMKHHQRELDRRIFRMLGVPLPTPSEKREIKEIDLAALRAEAAYLGPPGFPVGGVEPRWIAVVALCRRDYPLTIDPDCAAVVDYIQQVSNAVRQ